MIMFNMSHNMSVTPLKIKNKTITLRQFESTESELKSCLQIQHDTWGKHAGDVPLNLLKINLMLGGIVAGAFDEDGRCLGIIISMPGQFRSESAHWSYRLAVTPEMREFNLGRKLKDYQRELCKAKGIDAIYWTYDPLQSKNAHFNINKLGCQIVEYQENFLPESSPELHLGMGGTDRFVVRWDTTQEVVPPTFSKEEKQAMPILTSDTQDKLEILSTPFKLSIPTDINVIKHDDPKQSERLRYETRSLFQDCLERGKEVVGFYKDDEKESSFYILQ